MLQACFSKIEMFPLKFLVIFTLLSQINTHSGLSIERFWCGFRDHRTCAYRGGVRNISFSENFANLLNGYLHAM